MESSITTAYMETETVHYCDKSENSSEFPWTDHPKFTGVYLKHLIKGTETDGLFSAHIVKIDPNCSLMEHCHEDQWELHEIVKGYGVCRLGNVGYDYHSGIMAVIPKGVSHGVRAGEDGLILLAKFFPALL